jgi:transposase
VIPYQPSNTEAAMRARGLAIQGDLDAAALRRFVQTEPDRRAALRALAIAQALEGASRAEAARVVGRERQSLRDAVVRYNAEGLTGLRDRPRSGRREKLDAAQQATLRAWVLQGPDPDRDEVSSYRLLDIAAHIEQRWGVSYTLSALSRLLRRMKLSWQKARPAHPKGSVEARELYKNPRRRAGGGRRRPPRQAAPGLVRG